MKAHKNYFEIDADTHFDLGLRRGELFGDFLQRTLKERKREGDWRRNLQRARAYVGPATNAFPQLVEEVHGYAEGAGVCFEEAWLMILEDELDESDVEKCTTVVTNRGLLVAHNEDWERSAKNAMCVLRTTIGNVSCFELYYMNTLGGVAISVNSHGFVHAINWLSHVDRQVGVPRNLVARWLSETNDPEEDFERLQSLRRASGYSHVVTSFDGRIWNIESTATKQVLVRPEQPFVHTNHYLTGLSKLEGSDTVRGTHARYDFASSEVSSSMSVEKLRLLMSDTSQGRHRSLLNNRTIARMIVDIPQRAAHVWLLREKDRGWVSYPLDPAWGDRTDRHPAGQQERMLDRDNAPPEKAGVDTEQ